MSCTELGFGLSILLGINQFESRNTELHLKLGNKINLSLLSSDIADFFSDNAVVLVG